MVDAAIDDPDVANFVKYANRSLEQEEEFHFLRFEFLQRLNLSKIQVDLVRTKSRFQRDGYASADDLRTLQIQLQDYGTLNLVRLRPRLIRRVVNNHHRHQQPPSATTNTSSPENPSINPSSPSASSCSSPSSTDPTTSKTPSTPTTPTSARPPPKSTHSASRSCGLSPRGSRGHLASAASARRSICRASRRSRYPTSLTGWCALRRPLPAGCFSWCPWSS